MPRNWRPRVDARGLRRQHLWHDPGSRLALAEATPAHLTGIPTWRGQKNQAFQWLERPYPQHDAGLSEVNNDPMLVSLRADPR